MTSIGSPSPFFLAGKKAYAVDRSLRFNRADSTYVTRSVSSTGNRRTWTVSFWMKFCEVVGDSSQRIWSNDSGNGSGDILKIEFDSGSDSNRRLSVIDNNHAGSGIRFVGERRFRDPSAWYHIVLAVDTTQATATNRVKIYVNNEQVSDWRSGSEHNHPPNQNYDTCVNLSGKSNTWGRSFTFGNSSADHFDGYLTEINFIDGFQYDPSYFGTTDVITGQWNPKKYVGSYGTNGYYLNFSDNSGTSATTLGKDSSGNGNNFTPNNFSVAAGDGNDSVTDTPSLNKATLNPLTGFTYNATLSEGNLKMSGSGGFKEISTVAFAGTSKFYYEVQPTLMGGWQGLGVFVGQPNNPSNALSNSAVWVFASTGDRYQGGSYSSGGSPSWNASNLMGIKYENGTLKIYKDGTLHSTTYTGIPTNDIVFAYIANDNANAAAFVRFNSDSWTQGSAAGVDSTWELSTANLPDPTIKLPNKHFDTLLYTGNDGSQSITGLNFQPDWAWIKERSGAYHHSLTDSVRGVLKTLSSSRVDIAEYSESSGLNEFLSNGLSFNGRGYFFVNRDTQTYAAWNWNAGDTDGKTYTVKVVPDSGNKYRFDDFGTSAVTLDLAEGGTYVFDWSDSSAQSHPVRFSTTSDGTHGGGSEYTTGVVKDDSAYKTTITVPASAPTLYYYCQYHSGMGGQANTNSTLGSSNFDGTIQSVAKVNASAGFSITKYTGTGSAGATVGHGLGVAPNVIIIKNRTDSSSAFWAVYHSAAFNSASDPNILYLNEDDAESDDTNVLGTSVTIDSTKFSLGDYNGSNGSGDNMISYCFSEVAGYSKFGSYVGNGSTDGPFVFTGFRPAWVMIKRTDSGDHWNISDAKRGNFNEIDEALYANNAQAEGWNGSLDKIDYLSNGFKLRANNSQTNYSGGTYIYLAFSESPFKNARAR